MRTSILFIAVVWGALMCAVAVSGDKERDAARLDDLLSKVRAILPSGWAANVKLSDDKIPDRRGSFPTLVIKSNEPLAVVYFYPGMPMIGADEPERQPKITQEIVALHFVALPLVTPQDYTTIREHNDSLRRKRSKFVSEHLEAISSAYKGPRPIPPYAFEPKTEDDSRLIRQYAFLWISTQPPPLPTHHTDHLSFVMHLRSWMHIHNAEKSKQYARIVEAVQGIIVPYEKER